MIHILIIFQNCPPVKIIVCNIIRFLYAWARCLYVCRNCANEIPVPITRPSKRRNETVTGRQRQRRRLRQKRTYAFQIRSSTNSLLLRQQRAQSAPSYLGGFFFFLRWLVDVVGWMRCRRRVCIYRVCRRRWREKSAGHRKNRMPYNMRPYITIN